MLCAQRVFSLDEGYRPAQLSQPIQRAYSSKMQDPLPSGSEPASLRRCCAVFVVVWASFENCFRSFTEKRGAIATIFAVFHGGGGGGDGIRGSNRSTLVNEPRKHSVRETPVKSCVTLRTAADHKIAWSVFVGVFAR